MDEKVVCVDDDLNILLALHRKLRNQFHMESALGGQKALDLVRHAGPFAVIVSDLQMPGMNGLELLAAVKEISPDTVRIMLTGKADLETAIAAVNQGNIFRFLTKPCSSAELGATISSALTQYRLITAERSLLEETLHGSVKVLTEVLSLVHPAAFSRASRIHLYVRHMATELKVADLWKFEVAALLSQIGCITMEPGTLDRIYVGEELSDEEKKLFADHPAAARDLLATITRLEPVAEMIAGQNLPYQEPSEIPLSPAQQTIVTGTHFLRAAIDFDRLMTGGHSPGEALAIMHRSSADYAPACLEALARYVPQGGGMEVRVLKVAGVAAGMLVDQDVRSRNGLLLLAKGQEVTPSVLTRLRAFDSKIGIVEPIRLLVRVPSRAA